MSLQNAFNLLATPQYSLLWLMFQVVRSVIYTLHEELLRWRNTSSRISTDTLRQGATLLHAFSVQVSIRHQFLLLWRKRRKVMFSVKWVILLTHWVPWANSLCPGNSRPPYPLPRLGLVQHKDSGPGPLLPRNVDRRLSCSTSFQ